MKLGMCFAPKLLAPGCKKVTCQGRRALSMNAPTAPRHGALRQEKQEVLTASEAARGQDRARSLPGSKYTSKGNEKTE